MKTRISVDHILDRCRAPLARLLHGDTDIFALLSTDGTIRWISRDAFGYKRNRLTGMSLSELSSADRADLFRTHVRRMHGVPVLRDLPVFIHHKNGTPLSTLWSLTLTRTDSEPSVLAWIRDVTEIEQTRWALRQQSDRLLEFSRSALIVVYDVDLGTGNVLFASGLKDVLGIEKESIRTWPDLVRFIHPHDVLRYRANRQKAVADTDRFTLEYRFLHGKGGVIDVRESARVIRHGGRAFRVVGGIQDVTAQHAAELAVIRSEMRLKLAVDSAKIGIYEMDLQTGRVLWDRRVRAHWGVSKDFQVTPSAFLQGLRPADRNRVKLAWKMARDPQGSGRYDLEYRVTGIEDGVERWIAVTGQVQFLSGRAIRLVGTTMDISAVKRAEESMRESRDDLERKVKERTAELEAANRELRASRDALRGLASELVMAEERERKKVSIVLHDEIAQSLAAAQIRVDMLGALIEDEDFRRTARDAQDLIGQSIRKTRGLMGELVSPVLYDLGLKSAVARLVENVSEKSGIAVDFRPRGDLEVPLETRVTVYQILKELLQNVAKHSRASRAKVDLRANHRLIRMAVCDNGVGFDPEGVVPGTEHGFGLFSIRERVGHLGGAIRIRSRPGRETRVAIELPCTRNVVSQPE